MVRHVIVGGGIAGTTAAATIRKMDPGADITIVSDEDRTLYSRIRLPELLSGAVTEDQLVLRREEWYEKRRITLLGGETLVDIDPEAHVAVLASGGTLEYDRLLLATGSRPNVPPIEGVGRPGVFTIRTMDDALALRDRVGGGDHTVAVIGGGVLGLEIAFHLGRAGNRVEVLEFFSRLLPKQTDPESSTMFQHMLEEMGLNFHIDARSDRVAGGEEGPEEVLLDDGRRIECDTVVICAGVRPTLKLSGKLGLEIGRGIVVDDRLRTGAPDVWAAGDLIEHRGKMYGIWQPAELQGEVAGTNMAGGEAVYEGTTISNTLKVVGVDLFAAGDIDPAGLRQTVITRDPERGVYRKLVIAEGRVVGAILLGDTSDRRRVLEAIESGQDVSGTMARLDWCDVCGL